MSAVRLLVVVVFEGAELLLPSKAYSTKAITRERRESAPLEKWHRERKKVEGEEVPSCAYRAIVHFVPREL